MDLGLMALLCFILGLFVGFAASEAETVTMSDLRRNGYEVVRHEERHGGFRTNWVEVVRR